MYFKRIYVCICPKNSSFPCFCTSYEYFLYFAHNSALNYFFYNLIPWHCCQDILLWITKIWCHLLFFLVRKNIFWVVTHVFAQSSYVLKLQFLPFFAIKRLQRLRQQLFLLTRMLTCDEFRWQVCKSERAKSRLLDMCDLCTSIIIRATVRVITSEVVRVPSSLSKPSYLKNTQIETVNVHLRGQEQTVSLCVLTGAHRPKKISKQRCYWLTNCVTNSVTEHQPRWFVVDPVYK